MSRSRSSDILFIIQGSSSVLQLLIQILVLPKTAGGVAQSSLWLFIFMTFFFPTSIFSTENLKDTEKHKVSFFCTDSRRGSCEVGEKDSPRFKYQVCFLHSLKFGKSPNPSDLCFLLQKSGTHNASSLIGDEYRHIQFRAYSGHSVRLCLLLSQFIRNFHSSIF